MLATLFLFGLIIVMGAMTGGVSLRKRRRREFFRLLARRFRGSYASGGLFGQPSSRFLYGTAQVFVSFARTPGGGGRCLLVSIRWPESRLNCEVFPARPAYRQPVPAGLRDLTVGSESFATQYVIRGNDQDDLRHFLSEGVQWQVDQLRHLWRNNDVYLRVCGGRMVVRKSAQLQRFEDLERFAQLCLELYDQAMLTRSVGIEFVDSANAQILTEVVCQVCGDDIVADMVFCSRCRTPHHLECWQYYGSCSTYGCQETRYAVPTIARPTQQPG